MINHVFVHDRNVPACWIPMIRIFCRLEGFAGTYLAFVGVDVRNQVTKRPTQSSMLMQSRVLYKQTKLSKTEERERGGTTLCIPIIFKVCPQTQISIITTCPNFDVA